MNCPNCNSEIQKENINIMTDIAQCQQCNNLFKISENLTFDFDDGFDINNNPNGTWIKREINQIKIGASTRSPIAFFLVPFMLVWSGGSLGGIYGSQILRGDFNPTMSLFGIPFIIGSVLFWSFALMAIWGKVELTLDRMGGSIFTGVGNVGLTKKFKWEEVSTIKERQTNVRFPGSNGNEIQLEGKKRISFGSNVNDSRKYYLFRTLKQIISKVKSNKSFL
jgi:hypothetical protein